MAAVTGITLVKQFTYRADASEQFSNRYHFKGLPPGDTASWDVLAQDIWNIEKVTFTGSVTLVAAYGYDSDDPKAHHVYAHDYTVPGPPPAGTGSTGGVKAAGDQAAMIEWRMDRLSSKGKPIFLRKYLHDPRLATGGGDNMEATYISNLEQYAANMAIKHGGMRSQTKDDNVVAHIVHPYVTTRTLKRRGKRPKTGT